MTDKEIIIDGCNVSECLFYQSNFEEDYDVKIKHFCSNWHNSCESANNSNCYYKQLARKTQECEELKKEIINKNEKIKELRFSVSDLTNRLCYLNAEKSFRIVDLEQALNEIEKQARINCEEICGKNYDTCKDRDCLTTLLKDIISKAKDGKNE